MTLWGGPKRTRAVRVRRVIRSPQAEAVLEGQVAALNGIVDRAAMAAIEDTRPIDDFRASAKYRRELVAVGVRRTLGQALDQAVRP